MARLLVTKTKTTKVPYRMEESGHALYSYEELCYYMRTRMALWMEEKNRPGMTSWLKNCGIEVENADFCSPYDAAGMILEAGTYYRKEEKEQILKRMKEWFYFPEVEREKETGDLYLHYGRVKKAYLSYAKVIKNLSEGEMDSFVCSLYHNMGLCCLRLFYWGEAEVWLSKAFFLGKKKETENALLLVKDMKQTDWSVMGDAVSMEEIAKKKAEFRNEL